MLSFNMGIYKTGSFGLVIEKFTNFTNFIVKIDAEVKVKHLTRNQEPD